MLSDLPLIYSARLLTHIPPCLSFPRRRQEEFLEFFNLRLQAKFADFLQKEGWRKLSPEHGHQGHHDESGYDSSSAGGGDGVGGRRGSARAPAVKVDGQMVSRH